MDTKNSMILANMMSSKGGVEFKTYCYATGNAYISTKDIESYATVRKMDITLNVSVEERNMIGQTYRLLYMPQQNISPVAIRVNISSISSWEPLSTAVITLQRYVNSTENIQTLTQNETTEVKGITGTTYNARWLEIFNNYITQYKYIKILNIKLYDSSNNLVGELKPAIVNGESGMYDTVGQKFYGNTSSVGSIVCE